MPRLFRRSQLAVHIKRAICQHHVSNPRPLQVNLAKCAYPKLEQAMVRWIRNAGSAGVPLNLATIRDDVATIACGMALPATFRCSVGWVRRAMRRHGIRYCSATSKASDQDYAAVHTCKEQLPKLLIYLSVRPRDVFNFDETGRILSILPRKTYSGARVARRKLAKDRLTVGLLVNVEGSHVFLPLIMCKAKRPRDFLPDYDGSPLNLLHSTVIPFYRRDFVPYLFTHFIEQLNAAMYAEDRNIVVLLDNASSHNLRSEDATSEDLFGFRTRLLSNVRLVFLSPNTTTFTQPLDQGLIAMTKARYRQHWLRALTALWQDASATSVLARFHLNVRDVIAWLSDAWMNVPAYHSEVLVAHGVSPAFVGHGTRARGRGRPLHQRAMPAAEFVAVDDDVPTCVEPGEDPLALEPTTAYSGASWEAPASMQEVYDDDNPESREARRYARVASEMLIGYARATGITPRNLCALFEIKNPMIVDHMERASPALNMNTTPPPAPLPAASPTATAAHVCAATTQATTPRRRGRVLPAWMYAPAPTCQQLIDSGVPAVMNGYVDAAEWMTL
ncbi:unnamed protein product [Closterium sp. Yama58-4]|nr:unnamed protein product [Closterium sp. Yama58-4]